MKIFINPGHDPQLDPVPAVTVFEKRTLFLKSGDTSKIIFAPSAMT